MKRADLEQIVQECRALAVTLRPSSSATPPAIFNADAEATLLASIIEGILPSAPVSTSAFYCLLHRDIAEVLNCCKAGAITPTVRSVLAGLDELGVRGPHLERAVRRIFESTPVSVRIDELAHVVRSLAWRRRLVSKIDRLRAMLVEKAVPDIDVEAAIDSLVETGAEQPRPSSEAA